VGSTFELPSPGADEFSLLIENHHRVGVLARPMNSVMDIDMTLRILTNPVGIAILDRARQLAPIMNRFVLVFPFSNDRQFGATLSVAPRMRGVATPAPAVTKKLRLVVFMKLP